MATPAAAAVGVRAGTKRSCPGAEANSERRVLPRHFHFGPNPAAVDASSGGDVAASESNCPPPAARLYRHALESIFAFLNQRELVAVLQVSKSWLAAVESMASLQLTVEQISAPLREVADSTMGRHVARLGSHAKRVPLTADSLFILARHAAHLRVLNGEIQLAPPQRRLTFPRGLHKLRLRVSRSSAAEDVSAVLIGVSHLPLLKELIIHLPAINSQLSFAPLASLPLLRHLNINAPNDAELSDAQVDQLRALPLLQGLFVRSMSTSLLRRLLAQPHELQWQRIALPKPLDDEATAVLAQLPSLTALNDPILVTCSRFDFLRQLRKLANVLLCLRQPEDAPGRIESLIGGLQCCTQIEVLTLVCKELTAAQLADLLTQMPRLHTLVLAYATVTTLSFLAQPPMTDQLTSLQLRNCVRLPLTELRHVHALRGLQTLVLYQTFSAPMDALCQSLHTPPSLLLPQLEKFCYKQP